MAPRANSNRETASVRSQGVTAGASLQYELIACTECVRSIAREWDDLLEESECNRAFSSSTWFLAALSSYGHLSPHVIIARRGETLAGVFPLAWEAESERVVFPARFGDYNDIVAGAGDIEAAVFLLRAALSSCEGMGARLVLRCLRTDSGVSRAVADLRRRGELKADLVLKGACPFLKLDTDFESYLAGRGRRFRKGLRYTERRASLGQVNVAELLASAFAAECVAGMLALLNAARFDAASCFSEPENRAFIDNALPGLFRERRIRVFAVFDRKQMVAMDVCMVGHNSLCAWNGGFLAEAAPWSPGRLMMAAEIRSAISEGLHEYDLLRGNEEYKTGWATASRQIARFEFGLERQNATKPHRPANTRG